MCKCRCTVCVCVSVYSGSLISLYSLFAELLWNLQYSDQVFQLKTSNGKQCILGSDGTGALMQYHVKVAVKGLGLLTVTKYSQSQKHALIFFQINLDTISICIAIIHISYLI